MTEPHVQETKRGADVAQESDTAPRVMTWPFPGLVIPDPEPPWTRWDTLAVLLILTVAGAIAAVILL